MSSGRPAQESDSSLDHASSISPQSEGTTNDSCISCWDGKIKSNKLPMIPEWQMENLDLNSSHPQSLEQEMERLQVLKSYSILDADRDPTFERLTALATRIFNVPIALVSLVDFGRQWFLSNRGLGDTRETPRKFAFCAHALLSHHDVFVVPDAAEDVRFKDNPLVLGDPFIRFYAGAPLLSPEGYKLGTFCIIHTKPFPDGLNLEEKQNLRELSALVMDSLVAWKKQKEKNNQENIQAIACTAHDLLTPLTAINLNLSLLAEDESLKLDHHQRDLIHTAVNCTDVMSRLCHQTMEVFRGNLINDMKKNDYDDFDDNEIFADGEDEEGAVVISRLVENISQVIEAYPKKVPLTLDVHDNVPPVIISDDVRLFRSAINFLTNACKATESGSINFRIYVKSNDNKSDEGNNDMINYSRVIDKGDMLVFECKDTGPGVEFEKCQNLFLPFGDVTFKNENAINDSTQLTNIGLGLFSVATSITKLGGEYGYLPREANEKELNHQSCASESDSTFVGSSGPENITGSIFWFSVPIMLPLSVHMKKHQNQMKKEDIEIFESKEFEAGSTGNLESDSSSQMQPNSEESSEMRGMKRPNCSPSPPDNMIVQIKLDCPPAHTNELESSECSEGSHKRVTKALIIDDSLTIRKGIARALTKLGFEVQQARNGFEGLGLLKKTLYDLVLCDFLMPVMDGLDCVKQYRDWELKHRSWFRQYIIGISAHATTNDAERGRGIGMDDYFSKPLTLKVLKELSLSERVINQTKILDKKYFEKSSKHSDESSRCDGTVNDDASISSISLAGNSTSPMCLIAEDSNSVRKALGKCVQLCGWRSATVKDGEDALRLLKIRSYDAVFIDGHMPKMTGTDCIRQFREWEAQNRVAKQRHVYLISGSYIPKQHSILPPGFDGALGKPVKTKELAKLLENLTKSLDQAQILAR